MRPAKESPMRDAKRAKPERTTVALELAAARKSLRNEAFKRRELEKRLTQSLEREKATGEILHEKNRALTEALDQQTATSEVLKVISRSAFDLQPVFETAAESAVTLCQADTAFIFRFDGTVLRAAASYNASPELKKFVDGTPFPRGDIAGRRARPLSGERCTSPTFRRIPSIRTGRHRWVRSGRCSGSRCSKAMSWWASS